MSFSDHFHATWVCKTVGFLVDGCLLNDLLLVTFRKKPPIGDIELESSRVILLVVKAAKKFVGILRNSSGTR